MPGRWPKCNRSVHAHYSSHRPPAMRAIRCQSSFCLRLNGHVKIKWGEDMTKTINQDVSAFKDDFRVYVH